jgi:prepilin-type N-terminal cleavage/methylation domain-containing protein
MSGFTVSHRANGQRCLSGMTLIELTIAMMVISLVLTGVAALAYAISSVKDASDDTSQKQAYVRFSVTQLAQMIRHARLVCYASTTEVVLWTTDTNSDGLMNVCEMACIRTDTTRSTLTLSQFTSATNPAVTLSTVGAVSTNWWLAYGATAADVTVIPQCSGATFMVDAAVPASQYVSLSYVITQNGEQVTYTVSGYLQSRAANALTASDSIASDDD